ncbi:MAG: carboxypeptidase regulatory-like domain-containing protein [Rhodothermales bacterium]
MLRRFAAALFVLLPLLVIVGCENELLEPDLRGAIEGQVFDFDTREPLSGVNITTNPPTGSLITDEEGRFRLDDLPTGNYSVAGRRSGYDANSITVSVLDGETRTAILLLEQETEEDTTSNGARFDASVLNFSNQSRQDSSFVVVEYRARNTGGTPISAYEIYFQLLTTGQTYFEEVSGTNLGVGQSDIGEFEQYVGRDTVIAVEISDVFFDGQ